MEGREQGAHGPVLTETPKRKVLGALGKCFFMTTRISVSKLGNTKL